MRKQDFFNSAQNLLKEKDRFEQMSDWNKTIYYIACKVNSNLFSFFTGIVLAIPVNLLTNFFSEKVSSVSVAVGIALAMFFSFTLTFHLIMFTVSSIEIQ